MDRNRSLTEEFSSKLEEAASLPVLKREYFSTPIIIDSIELLYNEEYDFYLVRSRSKDGAEGIAVANKRANFLSSILQNAVIPYFLGKDARDLELLIEGVFKYKNNYKLSGVAFWSCVAWVEFSLLDMLGKIINKPVGELLGNTIRREIPIYVASGRRETTPKEEVDLLVQKLEATGARAVKFKLGGRMSKNVDSIAGRTEGLIHLSRKVLGDQITIHADGNGSFDVEKAIEIGRLLEGINAYFYEEPCPFDYLEETKQVASALSIPIAFGEQETSLRRFRWIIENKAARIIQPDLHYNGGFIRTTRVARMAELAGLPTTVHISGDGLGFLYMLHFTSYLPNPGRFQEFKGDIGKTGLLFDPIIKIKDGNLQVPMGPGLGVTAIDAVLQKAKKIN